MSLTFAEFLAADDRDPIVLLELQPACIPDATAWAPFGGAQLFGLASTGTARNDVTGCVGVKFLALADILIYSLGRYKIAGNAQTHTLRLMQESASGTLTTLHTATLDLSTAGVGFAYADIPPTQLQAGVTYHIYSSEIAGGDSWYSDDNTVLTVGVAGAVGSMVGSAQVCGAATYTPSTVGPNHVYGPVNAVCALAYTQLFPKFVGTDKIPGGIYRRVDGVRINGVPLAHASSQYVNPGEWWYDPLTETLYVSANPPGHPASVTTIVVLVTIFAATSGLILDQTDGDPTTGVYYRPIVIGGVSSVVDQAADPVLGGIVTLSGQIDLMNEAQTLPALFAVDGGWIWRDCRVSLFYGGRVQTDLLPRSAYYPMGTALIAGVAADE